MMKVGKLIFRLLQAVILIISYGTVLCQQTIAIPSGILFRMEIALINMAV